MPLFHNPKPTISPSITLVIYLKRKRERKKKNVVRAFGLTRLKIYYKYIGIKRFCLVSWWEKQGDTYLTLTLYIMSKQTAGMTCIINWNLKQWLETEHKVLNCQLHNWSYAKWLTSDNSWKVNLEDYPGKCGAVCPAAGQPGCTLTSNTLQDQLHFMN